MNGISVSFLSLRILISCIGLVGNVILILSIIQTKFFRVKSFEFFLLGLATANLEEIVIMNIYDTVILEGYFIITSTWPCRILKFLTVFGEISSILFTVLISIYRYQKLRDASKRASLPICLDSIRSAWMVSGVCVALSLLLSFPSFVIKLHGPAHNATGDRGSCPPDFFQCDKHFCPLINCIYKYMFLMMCNLLPLIIVTGTGCLIIRVLLSQGKRVTSVASVSMSSQNTKKSKGPRLQRSLIAVLAAMGLFQLDWTLYLIFQLAFMPTDLPFWDEMEFFISASYASISPFVYGIGNNLFSVKNLMRKWG
nr:PREDICTED: gonadotropin-releasing hormone receptor-like [Paralichthys olivaceus]